MTSRKTAAKETRETQVQKKILLTKWINQLPQSATCERRPEILVIKTPWEKRDRKSGWEPRQNVFLDRSWKREAFVVEFEK